MGKKPKSRWARWLPLVAGVPALVAGIVALANNLGTIRGWIDPGPGSARTSYARLFGAYQVPAIMFRSDWLPGGIPNDSLNQATVLRGLPNFRAPLMQWDSSELRDATFAMGPLGEQIAQAFERYYRSSEKDLTDPLNQLVLPTDSVKLRFRALETGVMARSEEEAAEAERTLPPYEPGYKASAWWPVQEHFETESQKIGFLFLMVENSSKTDALTELQLDYEVYSVGRLGERCLPSKDRRIPQGVAAQSRTLAVGDVRQEGTLLLPLAIYRTDNQRFPAAFCSDVIMPTRLTWNESGRSRRLKINPPRLDGSARVTLPFRLGWYRQ